jgi:hypothetical protein
MAPKSKTAASRANRAAARNAPAVRSVEESLAVLAGGPVPLSEQQEEILNAEEGTSEITPGGVVEADPRMESDGVKSPIKADFDNPESGLVYDEKSTLASPEKPGDVKVGPGETPAQHEAHVQLSGAAIVQERLEREEGPEGLPTDVIAREQQTRAANAEFQRVDSDMQADRGESGNNPNKLGPNPVVSEEDEKK